MQTLMVSEPLRVSEALSIKNSEKGFWRSRLLEALWVIAGAIAALSSLPPSP